MDAQPQSAPPSRRLLHTILLAAGVAGIWSIAINSFQEAAARSEYRQMLDLREAAAVEQVPSKANDLETRYRKMLDANRNKWLSYGLSVP